MANKEAKALPNIYSKNNNNTNTDDNDNSNNKPIHKKWKTLKQQKQS